MTSNIVLSGAIKEVLEKSLENVDIDTFEFKKIAIPNTPLELVLVKSGTEKERELDAKKGNLVGSFKYKEKEFSVFK